MTKLLEQAFAKLELMSPESQDAIARALLGFANEAESDDVEPEHLAAVQEGLLQAEHGEFADGDAGQVLSRVFRRTER